MKGGARRSKAPALAKAQGGRPAGSGGTGQIGAAAAAGAGDE